LNFWYLEIFALTFFLWIISPPPSY
jgi:hypothetical protein